MKTGIRYINIALKYIGLLYYKMGENIDHYGNTGYSVAGGIIMIFLFFNPIVILQCIFHINVLTSDNLLLKILLVGFSIIFIYFFDVKEYWKKYANEYEASCEEEQKKVDRRLKYLFGGLIVLTGISFYLLGVSRPD